MGTNGKTARKATTTGKAKQAAAIAAAESKEAEEDQPRKRGPGRPPKAKATDPASEISGLEGSEDDTGGIAMDIDWNGDTDLTWTMINAIEDEEETRRSLFPPPGSTKRTGGLPKKHYHWILAETSFANHPTYMVAFKKAVKPKDKKSWSDKIKNRLKIITDKTRAQIEMMGQTGAGVESVKDILPGTVLMTKWDEIKLDSPWFWEMRSLIGERPNLRPVGIGNNSDEMDTSLLLSQNNDNDHRSSSPDDFPDQLAGTGTDTDFVHDVDEEDSDDSDDSDSGERVKRKRAPTPDPASAKPTAKKTKPQPAISAPAAAATVKPNPAKLAKPTTAKDRLTAAVLAEEETAQALLRLKKDKNSAKKAIELAKIEALAKIKVEKAKAKGQERLARLQLARIKMEQAHQLQMAQFGRQSHAGPSSSFFGDDTLLSTFPTPLLPSDTGSSSASTPFGFDPNLQLPPGDFSSY
ncbi:hypothetical protein FB451DRAFT_1270780 [Mycena latifolia]|nr:hypothetical protein FB451DRAFT_1270780 [Mycena latifolia]